MLNKNNFGRYSLHTSLGAVFAECLNRTIRDLVQKPVFGNIEEMGRRFTNNNDTISYQKTFFYEINSNRSFLKKERGICSSKVGRQKKTKKTEA